MQCELCGSKEAKINCEIEGTRMFVCADCSRFGKAQKQVSYVLKDTKPAFKDTNYAFVDGYGMIVKSAREKLKLKQEDLAKKINERESLLHNIESEHIKPNIILARKLEKELKIKIVEEIKDETPQVTQKKSGSAMTFGDFIKR